MTAVTIAAGLTPGGTTQHQPWCIEHWDAESASDTETCWAPDLDLRVRPDTGDAERGRITVMMTHNSKPDPRRANRSHNITVFVDRFPDGEDSTDFDPTEAEVTAHALLAMTALSRGETSVADWHRTTAERLAAELLARREAGVR